MTDRFRHGAGSDQALVLVLLGPPGVGKGTQGRLLADSEGLLLLSTGAILRAAFEAGTPLGKQAQAYMSTGELVPDQLIEDLMAARLARVDPGSGFILDGYPRTVTQAKGLTEILRGLERHLTAAALFDASDDELVRRLSGRRSCTKCGRAYHVEFGPPVREGRCDLDGEELVMRADDEPETITNRLAVYRRDTRPVADYYRELDVLLSVDAARPPAEIQASLRESLAVKA